MLSRETLLFQLSVGQPRRSYPKQNHRYSEAFPQAVMGLQGQSLLLSASWAVTPTPLCPALPCPLALLRPAHSARTARGHQGSDNREHNCVLGTSSVNVTSTLGQEGIKDVGQRGRIYSLVICFILEGSGSHPQPAKVFPAGQLPRKCGPKIAECLVGAMA